MLQPAGRIRVHVHGSLVSLISVFFLFSFLCCESYCTIPRRLANTQLRLKNWRNRTAKEEERIEKTELSGTIPLTELPAGTKS
jgi:hypothetical protein